MNEDECWTEVCKRIAHLEKQLESLATRYERQLEILSNRVRILQFIVIGGAILDFITKSSKAAAFFR